MPGDFRVRAAPAGSFSPTAAHSTSAGKDVSMSAILQVCKNSCCVRHALLLTVVYVTPEAVLQQADCCTYLQSQGAYGMHMLSAKPRVHVQVTLGAVAVSGSAHPHE